MVDGLRDGQQYSMRCIKMTTILMTYIHLHKNNILDGYLSEQNDKYTEIVKSGKQHYLDFEVY